MAQLILFTGALLSLLENLENILPCAKEYAERGHGLFTYALLQGMDGKADGAPKDGRVTI